MAHECKLEGKWAGLKPEGSMCLEFEGVLDSKYRAGELWIENSDMAQQVNFCPVCGYEAKVKI